MTPMDPYALGQLVVIVTIVALIVWLIVRAVIKVVRFNVIKKKSGAEAAQEFWDAKKKPRNSRR